MKDFYLFEIHQQQILFDDEKVSNQYFYSQFNLFCFTNHKSFNFYILAHKDKHSFVYMFNKADELLALLKEKSVKIIEYSIDSYFIKNEAKYRHKLIAKLNDGKIFHYNFSNGYEYWTKAEIVEPNANTKQLIANVSDTQFSYYKDLDYLTKLSYIKFDLVWHEKSSFESPSKNLEIFLNKSERQRKKKKRSNWLIVIVLVIMLMLLLRGCF